MEEVLVGRGSSGLVAALALRAAGIDCHVRESNLTVGRPGSALGLIAPAITESNEQELAQSRRSRWDVSGHIPKLVRRINRDFCSGSQWVRERLRMVVFALPTERPKAFRQPIADERKKNSELV